MKKYKATVTKEWTEEEIREMLGKGDMFPPEDEIEEWMRGDLKEDITVGYFEFEVIEEAEPA